MSAIAIATFADEGAFLRARLRAVTDGREVVGEWAPYSADGLAVESRTILPAMLIGGLVTGLALFALQSWSAGVAYPINSGGRALWSWQAFLPSTVEVAALGAAIAGVVVFFVKARLTQLHDPAFDLDEVALASQGAFVLALACNGDADANAAIALLAEAGAMHSRVVVS